jgi:hypothetical protein
MRTSSKVTRAKWTGGVTQAVVHLLCEHKALSSHLSPAEKGGGAQQQNGSSQTREEKIIGKKKKRVEKVFETFRTVS